ncbi:GLPGLI family protein [Chryseobacterium sp. NKUCC03_KSP]|uniref:GLPGLI family protein n=1 Tax=Chryseobacterium sp. NKUCC03_KSP TaxID=2842125 RepID=UPI001C5B4901|nr:GLPGLI family protein [Chryseobacterium sp. NKUCC03_KSP]MBW3522609.1 GLPGLI family protein [Chryseobacterium sp. NKUCC03_KSP]
MKRIFLLLMLVFSMLLSSQTQQFDHIVTYDLNYPIDGKKNDEQFILFIDSKENKSYFTATNAYVLDSLKKNGRIAGDDFMTALNYDTAFDEVVINRTGNLSVVEQIAEKNYLYIETPKIQWRITDEKKKENNTVLTKAIGEAFGRKWIAWFDQNVPLGFAPYKFTGLPGLVYMLNDEKNDFSFKLTQLKKKNKELEIPDVKYLKPISKAKINEIRFNSEVYGVVGVIEFENGKEREEWINKSKTRYLNSPRLDITN